MSKKKTMPVERTKAFRDMTFGEKIEHIWEYYKPAVFGIIGGVALIIYIIYKILNPDPEVLLGVTMVNSYLQPEAKGYAIFEEYLADNGYNMEEETINVNSSLYLSEDGMSETDMASSQALIVWNAAGEIDILTGTEHIMSMIGTGGGLLEMAEVLTPEQMEKYADRLYTVEDEESGEKYVCALKFPEGNLLTEAGYYAEDVWVAIPVTSKRQEMAKKVFHYLLAEEN